MESQTRAGLGADVSIRAGVTSRDADLTQFSDTTGDPLARIS